ncbi:MAG: vWA domain-containing protein, partial [Phycisphaerae bacterium]
VHAILPTLAAPSDVRLAALDAPPRADLGAPVAMRLRLVSTRPADVTVRFERLPLGDAPVATGDSTGRAVDRQRRVRVEPGVGAELLFEDTPTAEGDWTYTAQIAADSDAVPENNRASCVVRVGEPRTVLYVYAGAAPGPIFDLLRKHGLRVAAARAEEGLALPGAGASAVILDNVSAWTLGRESARRLADLVARGGLGLLAIGGDAAFAAGGYGDSPIEDVLPVSSRTGRRPPLEMVLVIDSSGSMNETVGSGSGAPRKITLAKQAVLALHAALAPADRIGIVAFAGKPRIVSTLVPASEWETLRSRLVSLEAGGGTRITPALAGALDLLPPARPVESPVATAAGENQPVRHFLLLSDGRSQDFDLPLLIGRCRERGVSVSAVATGADARLAAEADADLESLGRLARETGGRLYRSTDLAHLAETFLKDLTWARGEGLTEGVFPATWRDPQPVWQQPGPTLPAVAACNVTRPKEGASIPWETAGTELGTLPLLAVWRRGLGKAAAMPWPAGLATGAWTADDGLGRYLRDILAWLEGPASPAAWSARVFDRDGRWWVRVEQASSAVAATPVRFSAALFEAGAPGAREVALETVEPGAAEADLGPRTARGATLIVRSGDEGGERNVPNGAGPPGRMTLALPGLPPREYERFGVDRPLLERIVTAGGGKIHENPESLAEAVRQAETRHYMPVGIHLVWAAAAVVVGLVLGRLLGRL